MVMIKRRMAVLGSVAVAVGAVAVGTAWATPTGTAITGSNYPNAYTLIDQSPGQPPAPGLLLSGTYAGTASATDKVDSVCYQGTSSYRLGTSDVIAGGTFRVVGELPGGMCDLRVIPDVGGGSIPAESAEGAFAARRMGVNYLDTYYGGYNSLNAPLKTDYYVSLAQSGAETYYAGMIGISSGGYTDLYDANLDTSAVARPPYIPSSGTGNPGAQGGIRVDGVNALSLIDLQTLWSGDANAPSFGTQGITVSGATDPVTGDSVVVTTEPVLRCADPSLPATQAKCSGVSPTGVTATRVTIVSHNGRMLRYTDSFTSAAQHALSLDYEIEPTLSSPTWSSNGTTYATGTAGAAGPVLPAPATIWFKSGTGATSFTAPAGSVTYSTTPNSTTWDDGGDTFVTHYDRTIPANGSFTLTQTEAVSDNDPEVAAISSAARTTGLAPTLTLAPVPAVAYAHKLVVTGVAQGGQNGRPATVTGPGGAVAPVDPATGAFSLTVPLTHGTQTYPVIAADEVGAAASAQFTTSYNDPLSITKTKTTQVKNKAGKVTGLKLAVTVSCQKAAQGCGGKLVVDAAKNTKVASGTLHVQPGKSATVMMSLSSGGFKAYYAAHHPSGKKKATTYPVTVKLTFTDPDGSTYPVVVTKNLKL